MKSLLFILITFFSFQGLCTSKEEVKLALDHMRKTGMFTEAQIAEAEKQLLSMSQAEMEELARKGEEQAKNPEFQKQVMKMANDPEMKKKLEETIKQYQQTEN